MEKFIEFSKSGISYADKFQPAKSEVWVLAHKIENKTTGNTNVSVRIFASKQLALVALEFTINGCQDSPCVKEIQRTDERCNYTYELDGEELEATLELQSADVFEKIVYGTDEFCDNEKLRDTVMRKFQTK